MGCKKRLRYYINATRKKAGRLVVAFYNLEFQFILAASLRLKSKYRPFQLTTSMTLLRHGNSGQRPVLASGISPSDAKYHSFWQLADDFRLNRPSG
jgi:hypothetical protein